MTWLNSKSLTMKKLQGKVVLIDFWTYSCINCIRTTPKLNEWYKKYHQKGLEIIGVHTPEFEFEKKKENVAKAIKKMEIKYPVVLDSDYKIWNLYTNRWWPRKFLIDASGVIVYDHVGEGGYAETEAAIQKALMAIGAEGLEAIDPDNSIGGGICYRTTPETYLGFVRGKFGNSESFIPGAEHVFTDEGERREDLVYLHGHWRVEGESIKHTKKLAHATEHLALKYSAFSVNLVMGSTNHKPALIEVELDGRPLPEDMAGVDIEINEQGKALCKVNAHKMYRLVNADTYHRGTLKLKTAFGNLELFAFTFGGCKEN